jgi:anti-sigma regulatory factor (Ser/Thr protein kinase)
MTNRRNAPAAPPARAGHDVETRSLPSRLAAVAEGLEFVRTCAAQHRASERCIYNAELVFEEMFTNIVRHAHGGRGEQRIVVRMSSDGRDLLLEFEDDGPEFDPTRAAAPVTPASIAEARVGGLGIALVRKVASRMRYARHAGRNALSISLTL